MTCTHQRQLMQYPYVRVPRDWVYQFITHKAFTNEGSIHLFSLMALYSYACFRSHSGRKYGQLVFEEPGQYITRKEALPRILCVENEEQAMALMDEFRMHDFLTYDYPDEYPGLIRYKITGWEKDGITLCYNWYSYKTSGFFFFPLPVGRRLLRISESRGQAVFSELDALADMWLHTLFDDPGVVGSGVLPVVYYADMRGYPRLSCSYLAKRWKWSRSTVGRFLIKLERRQLVKRIIFGGTIGTVISMVGYMEMLFNAPVTQQDVEELCLVFGQSCTYQGKYLAITPQKTQNKKV